METVLKFLRDLSRNNNREWFQDNKNRYEECRDKVLIFTEILNREICQFDSEITLMNPRDCIFRIFRDVRFSNDKSPYKTHFGVYIAPGGRKSNRAGYYFHLEPDSTVVAGGIWCPEANVLKAVRTEIQDCTDEFKQIIDNPDFKKYYPEIEGEKLKTAPKGFDKNFPDIGLLCYKSYSFSSPISNEQLLGSNLIQETIKAFMALYPANRFLNRAIEKWL